MVRALKIFFLIAINYSVVYGNTDLDNYFFHIKSLDYESARKSAKSIKNQNHRKLCVQLANLLYFSGQKELNLDLTVSTSEEGSLTTIISKLTQGYYHLLYREQGKAPYQFFTEAYSLSVDLNYLPLTKFCLLSLIQTYNYELNKSTQEAFDFFEEFKKISEDNEDLYNYKMNLTIFYLRDTVLVREVNREYVESFTEFMKNFESQHNFWPNFYSTMGVIHEYFGSLDLAEDLYWKAINSSGDKPYLEYLKYRSLIHLSEIMRKKGSFKDALKYIEESKIYGDNSYPTRVHYYSNYYAAANHYGLNNSDSAYVLLNKAHNLYKKMGSEENNLENSRLKAKFENDKKEKKILEEQQKAQTNRNWLIAASLALLLGTGIAILLQKNTSKKRQLAEQEAILKQQRVENLIKEQELVSIDAMIAGQEKERQRVAGELHDDLGSLMATIKLHFDNAKVGKKDPGLQHAQRLLDEAYQKVRGMAHHKNSGVMSDQGLLPAIKKMAHTITETNALTVTVEDFGLGERMENSLELSIFRMVQELVANTIKHAEATELSIQLTQHDENLNIIIEDNGKGFDRNKLDKTATGMGLTNIEKRVEHLEGNFTIDSVVGKGTTILIDIPV